MGECNFSNFSDHDFWLLGCFATLAFPHHRCLILPCYCFHKCPINGWISRPCQVPEPPWTDPPRTGAWRPQHPLPRRGLWAVCLAGILRKIPSEWAFEGANHLFLSFYMFVYPKPTFLWMIGGDSFWIISGMFHIFIGHRTCPMKRCEVWDLYILFYAICRKKWGGVYGMLPKPHSVIGETWKPWDLGAPLFSLHGIWMDLVTCDDW